MKKKMDGALRRSAVWVLDMIDRPKVSAWVGRHSVAQAWNDHRHK